MTKTFKKITALAAAALTAGAISTAAYAVVFSPYSFNIYGYGHYEYSNPATKEDDVDWAAVHCYSGTVSETNFMFLTVHNYYNAPGSAATETVRITKISRDLTENGYSLNYENAPVEGNRYCLKGQIGYYDVQLSGEWIP